MRKGKENEKKKKTEKNIIKTHKKGIKKTSVRYWKKVDKSLLKVLSIFAINSNKTKVT